MKKNTLLTACTLALGFMPMIASAQLSVNIHATTSVQIEAGQASEAQILTACSQASIEIRDSAIGSARTAYNNAMAVALDARKEAEKKAVALLDADEKKAAIKAAVESYKKAVTQAQDGLTRARKDAWATFETNTKNCRDVNNDNRESFVAEKKETVEAKKTELRTMQAETKASIEEQKTDIKTLRETIKDALKAFFKIGVEVDSQ
jgi:NADH dehydrogenase/NADH:ubiquinone oxidoreductase subunit G